MTTETLETTWKGFTFRAEGYRLSFKPMGNLDYKPSDYENIQGSTLSPDGSPITALYGDYCVGALVIVKENGDQYALYGDRFDASCPDYFLRKKCDKCLKFHSWDNQ